MDIVSKEERSYIMSRIKNKNTKPEISVRSFLHSNGFRYRLHQKNLPGKPDIVLKKYKTVIFVHGCFWHGHYLEAFCKRARMPQSRQDYWSEKIERNIERYKKNSVELKKLGWNVMTIWECQLKDSTTYELLIKQIIENCKND